LTVVVVVVGKGKRKAKDLLSCVLNVTIKGIEKK
jgi:hypothetical protein